MRPRSTFLLLSLAGLAASALTGCGGTSSSSAAPHPEGVSGTYILALCDADMPASALVDRQLGVRSDTDKDVATIIGLPLAKSDDDRYVTPYAQIGVSNSVMGPPQAVAVTADGRRAYVIENQGPAPAGATTVDELPDGNKVTCIDLSVPTSPVEAGVMTVGKNPTAVDISPDGSHLCVVSQERRKQIQIIPISATGEMGQPLDWPLIGLDDDENTMPTCVSWHPSGDFLAVTVPNANQVVFYRVTREEGSIGLVPWGGPVVVGKYPYSGKFSPDGRFYITTDMQWGEDVAGVFVEPPQGQLSVVRFDATSAEPNHEVVAAAPVGVNPEGLALSPDGSLVVTANLLRSFLPDEDPRQTRGGSISLLRLDRSTGVLTPVEEYPIDSMPVGLTFDAQGNYVVVTQFRSFDPAVVTGELAFFHVTGGANPGLAKADFYVGVGKGPHGVLIVR
jgi:DNA-binding beta-propeller fold protein YncE